MDSFGAYAYSRRICPLEFFALFQLENNKKLQRNCDSYTRMPAASESTLGLNVHVHGDCFERSLTVWAKRLFSLFLGQISYVIPLQNTGKSVYSHKKITL